MTIYTNYSRVDIFTKKMTNELNILTVNIRSIRAHFEDLKIKLDILSDKHQSPDIIILTETWVGEEEKTYFHLDGYNSLFSGNDSRRGKGVIMYIKNNLPFNLLDHITIKNSDLVGVSITLNKIPLNIIGLYRNHAAN